MESCRHGESSSLPFDGAGGGFLRHQGTSPGTNPVYRYHEIDRPVVAMVRRSYGSSGHGANNDNAASIHVNSQDHCYSLARQLEWMVSWSRAFPTLLPWMMQHQGFTFSDNYSDENVTIHTRQRFCDWRLGDPRDLDDNDDDVTRLLQQMAFDEIFSSCSVMDSDNDFVKFGNKTHINAADTIQATHASTLLLADKDENEDHHHPILVPPTKPLPELLPRGVTKKHLPSSSFMMLHPRPDSSSNSLGYGEITASAVFQVISWIRRDADHNSIRDLDQNCWSKMNHTNHQSPSGSSSSSSSSPYLPTVLDLGSGNGKVLFASALAFPFYRAIGFEIVEDLHNEALMHLSQWNRYRPSQYTAVEEEYPLDHGKHTTTFATFLTPTIFDFRHGDLRQCLQDHNNGISTQGWWLRHVRLVWVHATVFDDRLMESVQTICEACSPGTYFAMVSKSLRSTTKGTTLPLIETRTVLLLPMSWGQATVYIQRKV